MAYSKKIWLKNITALIILLLSLIGVIGGAGNLIYFGQYVNAIGVLVCGWLAFPEAKKYWQTIIGD
jgi:hypothetical protein